MNRATLSLLITLGVLAAITGFATLRPDDSEVHTLVQDLPRPVERSTLTCPRPTAAESATTWYTGYTPPSDPVPEVEEGEQAGSADLLPAPVYSPATDLPSDEAGDEDTGAGEDGGDGGDSDGGDSDGGDSDDEADDAGGDGGSDAAESTEPVLSLEQPGRPVTVDVEDGEEPGLSGTAEESFAPGWTVQQTTRVDAGPGRGLLGTACQTPDTQFWFAGASTADNRHDYVHLTNPDDAATVVDIELYGPEGKLDSDLGEGIAVPAHRTVPVRLSTLTAEPQPDLAVQVTARTGRIGAEIEAVDEELGADWLNPVTAPEGRVVLPGIPANAEAVRLVAFAPGDEDITLDVGLAGPTGTITPAGNETVSLHAGTVTAVDLGNLTQGDAGSLILTPAEGSGAGRVVAAVQVAGVGDGAQSGDLAFVPAAPPVEDRATASGNIASGTTLALTAPDEAVEVEVTVSAGAGGGEPVTESYTVDGRTTMAIQPELPDSTEGSFALTVTTSGGPLYAARTLLMGDEDAPTFTVQTLPDDHSAVAVPDTAQDLSVLTD
ncbi:DUF5719 family protein [Streptomyces hoynatensis]|uniref:Secreted protein n=1 Tax=Streptomyces hoynatensis TaxID=1141874 RepID=A0A3A9YQB5_9ACTN|nr:DUF5719 family protein [Streptomyces hoynatensis]RKN37416.1 hypothetical protein D7294_28185 [Streptomyces hoynatensis]